MSDAPGSPSKKQMIAAAKLAARIGGCTCDVEVRIRAVRPRVWITDCAHDSWCKHPSQQKGMDA